MNEHKFRTVYPLPGSPKQYIQNLKDILLEASFKSAGWLRADCLAWLSSRFPISIQTANPCLQMIGRLGLLSKQQNLLYLTEEGSFYLNSEHEKQISQVAEILLNRGFGFPDILNAFVEARSAVRLEELTAIFETAFGWETSSPIEARIRWLIATECLEQAEGRSYVITDIGKELSERFPADIQGSYPRNQNNIYQRQARRLAKELEEAAIDGGAYKRLERATADAFSFLGYQVELLGGPGTTDIVLRADIGVDSYTVIVDAKARGSGKLDTIEGITLDDHRKHLQADYTVVVAHQFTGSKIHRQAQQSNTLLVTTRVLGKLLIAHSITPLSLGDYRLIFERHDELIDLPQDLLNIIEKRRQWATLFADLIDLIQVAYQRGWKAPLLPQSLTPMFVTRLDHAEYSMQDVQLAVEMLTHPSLRAATGNTEKGITLTVSKSGLAHMLHALADAISQTEARI